MQELSTKHGRSQHENHDHTAANTGIGYGEYAGEQWDQNVKLDFDLQRPGHNIDRTVAVVDEVVKIGHAGEQVRKDFAATLACHHKQDCGPEQQAQDVGWFEAGEPSQEILLEVNFRSAEELRGSKWHSENEAADYEEQFDTAFT